LARFPKSLIVNNLGFGTSLDYYDVCKQPHKMKTQALEEQEKELVATVVFLYI
jgi:hypothetical protein